MRIATFVLAAVTAALATAGFAGDQSHPASASSPSGSSSPAAAPPSSPAAAAIATKPAPVDALSQWGNAHALHVTCTSSISPLPLIRLHSWTVHVEDADGKPVSGATISVVGGMPEHTHGFPTVPEVRETGGGDYRIDGLKFHMPGKWTVVLAIRREDGPGDTVRFDVEVR